MNINEDKHVNNKMLVFNSYLIYNDNCDLNDCTFKCKEQY